MRTTTTYSDLTLTHSVTDSSGRPVLSVSIDLHDAISDLDSDIRRDIIANLGLDREIMAEALRRLTRESEAWSSEDTRTREEWLAAIGAIHAKDVKRYAVEASRARDELRDLKASIRTQADYLLSLADSMPEHGDRLRAVATTLHRLR